MPSLVLCRTFFIFTGLLIALSVYWSTNYRLLNTKINQLSIEVERRIQWWDWEDTEEEIYCRAPHDPVPTKEPIPNVVHFILIAPVGEVQLSYAQFLALKAAVLRTNATEIKLHTTGLDTTNSYWHQLKNHIILVPLAQPDLRGPQQLLEGEWDPPHLVDILRLVILLREGGIYLDIDVFVLKPFADLLNNPRDTLMGHEGGNRYGLCNAVIVSRPKSTFLRKWRDTYSTFDRRVWNKHSVRIPKLLQVQFTDSICPLSPTVFFWPTWAQKHVEYMHEPISKEETKGLERDLKLNEGAMYANQLAFHAVNAKQYLNNLTEKGILEKDTRFNVLVREIARANWR